MNEADARYLRQMQEISVRFATIDLILNATKPRNLRVELDNEVLWLQLRMIVELITFAGITADQQRYAALRAEALNNPDYTRDWKVNKILPGLSKVSRHFLPIALSDKTSRDAAGCFHLGSGSEVATLNRLIEIHERAGEHLHADNPFSSIKRSETIKRLRESRQAFLIDYSHIRGVLQYHAKVCLSFEDAVDEPTTPANAERVWLVKFDTPKKGHVQMLIGEATFEASPPDSVGPTIPQ